MKLPDGFPLDARELAVGVGIAVVSIVLSTIAGIVVVLRLPADYFVDEKAPVPVGPARFTHVARRVGKNLLGVVLVLVGAVLSLPGVPGQGLLTMLVGVSLLDVPGKRRFERRLVGFPRVLGALNRIRRRFRRAALQAPRFAAGDPQVPGEQNGGAEK